VQTSPYYHSYYNKAVDNGSFFLNKVGLCCRACTPDCSWKGVNGSSSYRFLKTSIADRARPGCAQVKSNDFYKKAYTRVAPYTDPAVEKIQPYYTAAVKHLEPQTVAVNGKA
jgi:hypothetical protein